MTDLLLSFRMRAVLAACSVVLLTACPPATTPEDAGPTPTEDGGERVNDAGTTADAGDNTQDAGGDAPDAGGDMSDADAGITPPDDAGTAPADDAGSTVEPPADAGPLAADFGPVQCRDNSDCGGGTCNRTAPGGICSGVDVTCPDGTEPNVAAQGACVRDCDNDADCSLGMRCGSGSCRLRFCDNDDECPAPYVCGAVGCERPPCTSSCPGGMVCADNLCMEP